MMDFRQQLKGARPILLDGAMGTELTRRGVETTLPLWSAGANESHPEAVYHIHLDYILAGAEIITTNTFRTQARTVRNSAKARALTLKAVEVAQQAREDAAVSHPVWIAGSVAPLEDCYSPHLTPPESYCIREHAEMVQTLVEGGVDILLIETMNTIHEAVAAALAAQRSGKPFVVSFILDEYYHLLSGEPLERAVEAVSRYQPDAIMVNCIPTRHILTALEQLQRLTSLPIGAYGNMGTPDDVNGWAFSEDIYAPFYAQYATEWMAVGAKIIGSCCGSTPEHTMVLRELFDQVQ